MKRVIYTCLVGDYDQLIEHDFRDQSWEYICFTDQRNLTSTTWKITPLQFTEMDNQRNQRWHKLHPHVLFPTYDESIYIDTNINVLSEKMFSDVQRAQSLKHDLAINRHFSRTNVYDEFVECKATHKDNIQLMSLEIQKMREEGFPGNLPGNVFFENNVIYRKHNVTQVIRVMNDWWWWLEHYSYRDQLSLPFVLWKNAYAAHLLSPDSYRNNAAFRFSSTNRHITKDTLLAENEKLRNELARIKRSKAYTWWQAYCAFRQSFKKRLHV